MNAAERQAYLAALGLTDWRLRQAPTQTPHATEHATEVEAAAVARDGSGDHDTQDGINDHGMPDHAVAQTRPAAADATVVDAVPPNTKHNEHGVAGLNWDELEHWLQQRNHRGAQRPVFGTGARDADLLIIGEAPGAQEDRQGLPFVGPAGKLLDRMLAAIGCARTRNAYITNICKFRPPHNRDPHADEVAADWPVLERQIELMNPKLVVAVGRVAGQTLLGRTDSLRALRGRVHQYPQRELPVIVTYHPAYLLRTPADKAKSWADLKHIAAILRAPRNVSAGE